MIFLTARHDLTDRLSGFAAGGDDYLPKPFHLAELAARLRAALKRAAPRSGGHGRRPGPGRRPAQRYRPAASGST